jgi:ATP-binding cassette subfamily B protein
MLQLVKYLKPFIAIVIAIVVLLFIQALCDLSLPDYMSDIVNVGIQQGGIKDAVPQVIRQSKMEQINYFLSEADRKTVAASYRLLAKNTLSPAEYQNYLRDYPALKNEPLYERKNVGAKKREQLNSIMGRAILMISEMEKNGIDSAAGGKLVQMPESMVTQAAAAYIRREYESIGLDTNKLQTNYILLTGLVMLLVTLISVTATILVSYFAAKVAAGVAKKLRRNVFRKVVSFSNAEFDRFSTASLITRSTNDVQQIQMLMVMLLRIVFYAPILGIGGVIKVVNSDFSMGWIIGVALAAIFAVVISMFGVVMPKFKMIQKLVDRLNLVTREILQERW